EDDELYRPPEQSALGVDVVTPKLQRGENHLAGCCACAGQGQADADLDRIATLRRGAGDREQRHNECRSECAERIPGYFRHRLLLLSEASMRAALIVQLHSLTCASLR